MDFWFADNATSHWWATARNVAVLDASFNPPTRAHAQLLVDAHQQSPVILANRTNHDGFDGFVVMISASNVDKSPAADMSARLAMMRRMVSAIDFRDRIAIAQTTKARFVDKAAAMSQHCPQKELTLYFILGFDTIVRLFDPKYYPGVDVADALEPLFQRHCLIVADRGGFANQAVDEFYRQPAVMRFHERIFRLNSTNVDMLSVSSTLARQAVQRGDFAEASRLLPESVLDWIRQNRHYFGDAK